MPTKQRILNPTLLIVVLLVLGCAPAMQAGGTYRPRGQHFSVDIPDGWVTLESQKFLLITKNNAYQQYIMVQERPVDQPFGHTRKKIQPRMLPQEAAAVIIDEIASDPNILNFRVLENGPVIIAGREGFKILFTYRDASGIAYQTVYYGFLEQSRFFNLRFNAAGEKHFAADISTFEKVLHSFRLLPLPPA